MRAGSWRPAGRWAWAAVKAVIEDSAGLWPTAKTLREEAPPWVERQYRRGEERAVQRVMKVVKMWGSGKRLEG